MSITEQIYELVKSLPPGKAGKILNFAESIRAKHVNTGELNDATGQDTWIELVESLAGSWREDFPTLEDTHADLKLLSLNGILLKFV